MKRRSVVICSKQTTGRGDVPKCEPGRAGASGAGSHSEPPGPGRGRIETPPDSLQSHPRLKPRLVAAPLSSIIFRPKAAALALQRSNLLRTVSTTCLGSPSVPAPRPFGNLGGRGVRSRRWPPPTVASMNVQTMSSEVASLRAPS